MFRTIAILAVIALLAACSRSSPPAPPVADRAPAASAPAASAPAPPPEASKPPVDLARLTRPESPVLGPQSAKVTLVEFLDPACEACRAFAPVVKQIQFLYPDDVRVVVRFADFHPPSEEAIRILLAAQRQHRFEEVLAALFDRQEEWASHNAPDIEAAWKIAAASGVNLATARKDAASAATTVRLQQETEDLTALQVFRTPTFYVNGKPLEKFGAEELMNLVKAEVAGAAAPAR